MVQSGQIMGDKMEFLIYDKQMEKPHKTWR